MLAAVLFLFPLGGCNNKNNPQDNSLAGFWLCESEGEYSFKSPIWVVGNGAYYPGSVEAALNHGANGVEINGYRICKAFDWYEQDTQGYYRSSIKDKSKAI